MSNQVYLAAQRMLAINQSHDDLLKFTQLTMPDRKDPDDSTKSEYSIQKHHRVIAASLEAVERGDIKRLIITMPPRHGKSELASKRFPAWFMGRNPYKSMILASYNEELAKEFGRKVREIMDHVAYKQIFPAALFAGGSAAADRISIKDGGIAVFTGAGGSITGRGADLLLIDDPVKNQEDANSASFREKQWDWFNSTAMSRLHGDTAGVVLIQTRWHEDDLVGRLTDPTNNFYKKEESKRWKILNLPAIAGDDDPMDRKPGEALWPEKYSLNFLEQTKVRDPRIFSALYQCAPAPPEGIFFLRKWITTYQPGELPPNLQHYCASDHAVATKQNNDKSCLIPFGVDESGDIWILPGVVWGRFPSDKAVEYMISMIQTYRPLTWYAEKGHISKSIGPFLKTRMEETEAYCHVSEVQPTSDKESRAQSIRGRVSMKKVHFPGFVPWWADALDEMLKFPAGSRDDFVDTLSLIGLALSKQVGASKPVAKKKTFETGSLAWLQRERMKDLRQRKRMKSSGF